MLDGYVSLRLCLYFCCMSLQHATVLQQHAQHMQHVAYATCCICNMLHMLHGLSIVKCCMRLSIVDVAWRMQHFRMLHMQHIASHATVQHMQQNFKIKIKTTRMHKLDFKLNFA